MKDKARNSGITNFTKAKMPDSHLFLSNRETLNDVVLDIRLREGGSATQLFPKKT